MHLGRLPEAEAALQQALQKYPDDAEVTANSIVRNVLNGKDASDLIKYVLIACYSRHVTPVSTMKISRL